MRRSRIRNALIVVVALAAVIPVTAYALRRAHEVSMQQTCAQNLKTLGEACKMYQGDWQDVLVPYGAPFDWPPKGGMWPDLLDPYLKKIEKGESNSRRRTGVLFKCPILVAEECCFSYHIDYGINEKCGGWLPDKKPVIVALKSVRYPESTIRIAETSWEGQGGTFFAANPSEFKPGDPDGHLFPTRHMGKGNVLWIDGHVSSMTQEQYNMRDKGPYDGNIWLRLEGPKPPVPGRRM